MARVEFTHNSLEPNLKKLPAVLEKNLYQVMRYHEPQLRAVARHDAPWKDRTTNARSGQDVVVRVPRPWVYELVLFGKVPYQLWLEIRWSGKYANIMPSIRYYAPKVKASFGKLLDRLNMKGSVR